MSTIKETPKKENAGNGSNKAIPAVTNSPADVIRKIVPESITISGKPTNNEQLYKLLNKGNEPLSPEELAKEKKRQKREALIAAIGDGIGALSNLFFTSRYAPNAYNGENTLSAKYKERRDKFMKDNDAKRNAYISGLIKARQTDEEKARHERSWKRQLGLDQEARDRYNESITHRNERERIADERYSSEQEYRRGRDEENDRRWQANFDEDKRRADRNYNFNVRQHNDNVAVRREAAAATRARGVRGKQLGFADGSGNQVAIYENVWKGSMQGIYDTLVADGIKPDAIQEVEGMSASDKEDFVKQNWYKSDKAKAQMLALSKLDPATMTSEVSDGEDGLGWGKSNSNNSNETDW